MKISVIKTSTGTNGCFLWMLEASLNDWENCTEQEVHLENNVDKIVIQLNLRAGSVEHRADCLILKGI